MTKKKEAAIVSAYTGVLIGDFNEMHRYIEEIMGRQVFTHELSYISDEITKKSKNDFMNIKVE